jgi:hypothetical protein
MYQTSPEDRLRMISGQQDELRAQSRFERMANEPSAKAAFGRSRARRVEPAGSHHRLGSAVQVLRALATASGATRTRVAR